MDFHRTPPETRVGVTVRLVFLYPELAGEIIGVRLAEHTEVIQALTQSETGMSLCMFRKDQLHLNTPVTNITTRVFV